MQCRLCGDRACTHARARAQVDEDGEPIPDPATFYYIGGRKQAAKRQKQCLSRAGKTQPRLCRCPFNWHVIAWPDLYSLVDSSWTLFEALKGNGVDEHGAILAGRWFGRDGQPLGTYKWNEDQEEYEINYG
jgi:hypothetical protein